MRIRLLLFAGLREAVGRKQLALEVPRGASVAEALTCASREHAEIARYRGRLLVSRNERRADLAEILLEGDELALLPPMSGGSGVSSDSSDDRVLLQASPLSLDALLDRVRHPACGGIALFVGVVRDQSRGQRIDHLEYEAYEPMARREMEAIAEQVRGRWPEVRLALSHRVGRLAIGDAAVMIAAGAPHRAQAFEACRFAIDTLKRTVPIWKKEFAEGGAYWVEENP
jgi:molybdopterin synthase catalytic subunit